VASSVFPLPAGLKTLEENLFYRAETLDKIFPKYFKNAGRNAAEYAKQPEKIANIVYASRMGNGDTASGDGYKFRGRGAIQLTGRENYTNFGKTIGLTAEQVIDYVQTKKGALESACWYWKSRNLNAACDASDIVKMTKLVNGGTIGLEDRKKHYNEALAILGGAAPAAAAPAPTAGSMRRGSKGDGVKKLQAALGLTADGDFGPGTEAALKKWQAANGLTADGVAGPKTLAKLLS
jgi:putative chitinase